MDTEGSVDVGRGTAGEDAGVSVLLVEDHALVAEGLQALLDYEPGVRVTGRVSTLADAMASLRRDRPDVVLMDFRLPDGDGATGTSMVRAEFGDIPVVILTAHTDGATLAKAVAAGCAGFLSKTKRIDEVVLALRAAVAGNVLLSPEDLARLSAVGAGGVGGERPQRPASPLSARELEVLQLLASGASTSAIVGQLVLSPHTVRNHVRNILTKLGAHSKLEAVTQAARDGLVHLPGGPGWSKP